MIGRRTNPQCWFSVLHSRIPVIHLPLQRHGVRSNECLNSCRCDAEISLRMLHRQCEHAIDVKLSTGLLLTSPGPITMLTRVRFPSERPICRFAPLPTPPLSEGPAIRGSQFPRSYSKCRTWGQDCISHGFGAKIVDMLSIICLGETGVS